jgi:nucleoside-diphosphate-sugar epimerase
MMASPAHPDPRPVLIIGCGYLGRRVVAPWRAAGRRVAALTRGRADELAALGVEPLIGDVLDPKSLQQLPEAATVLYAVGRDRAAGFSMREVYISGLGNVLNALPPPGRFLYISSTGVYGQTDGAVVDETSPAEPRDEAGRVALDAERLLRERLPAAVVLRFAGIYGPGRLLRRQAILNGEPLIGDAEKWLNLIHVEDGARAILAASERGRPGETYLIADDTPVRRRDFYTHLARELGAPPARFEPGTSAVEANRRVSNRKAREELSFTPRYPSYVEGLTDGERGG